MGCTIPPQYPIKNKVGGNKETNKNQQLKRQENRTRKHSSAPKYSQIKINVLKNKTPVNYEILYTI